MERSNTGHWRFDAVPLSFLAHEKSDDCYSVVAAPMDFIFRGAGLSSTSSARNDDHTDVVEEQRYVSMLYTHLDRLRDQARDRLDAVLLQKGGTPAERSDRDASATLYTEQLETLNAVESGLCFGRLDLGDGESRYVGRIGLFDDTDGYDPLLIDWRAPAARPFYLATAASPEGVRRRRHIRTRMRTVVAVDDEVLDLTEARPSRHENVAGEAALLAALNAGRTGRMRDIVATIQAEQDRIIRADPNGVLVVQGGPGTGKTAVALHRAAYLLYTHRRRLSSQGVLIVGPNRTFLRYISQVLPSLAETGVLLGTLGDLYPGVVARRVEPPRAAEIKGRLDMLDVLAAAVRDRQEVPDRPFDVALADTHAGFGYEHEVVRIHPQAVAEAREAARRSGRPHNLARAIFIESMIDTLAGQIADVLGADPYADDPLGGDDAPGGNLFNEADLADTRRELRSDGPLLAALGGLWPELTPEQLLTDLYASDERLSAAAPRLDLAERLLLRRDPGLGWTPADVPLLDEAAELLGADDRAARIRAERERRRRLEFAEGVLEISAGSAPTDVEDDSEVLSMIDLVSAEGLVERQHYGDGLTTAQRAAADRTWAFGHVIIDEAQELSPMAWRLLMRRCPSRSMTVAGDVAQTGALAGTSSWQEVLEPYVADRWRLRELTISYRTPAEIMDLAVRVLQSTGTVLQPPRSVRAAGAPPWLLGVAPDQLPGRLAAVVSREFGALVEDGNIGVIVPDASVDDLARDISAAFPDRIASGDEPDLERSVAVLTVSQAKGLEFDSVIVVEPERIVADSPRGHGDLYVAMTRATQRLGIIHCGTVLDALAGMPSYETESVAVG